MTHHVLSQKLWLKILIGMVIGSAIALSVNIPASWMPWVELPGDLFMALLKMVIVPLVLSSVILGIASAGSLSSLRVMGARLIPYFICTTALAITIGLSVTSIINPGSAVEQSTIAEITLPETTLGDLTIPDRIMNMIPVNPIEAQLTKNMLQLIVLGVIIGIALLTIRSRESKVVRDICTFTQDTCIMVVGWAMAIAPVAVASLMISAIISIGVSAIASMGLYMLSVLIGLACVFIMYLMIVTLVAHRNPFTYLSDIKTALMVAFSTSSSAATMPVSLSVAEERLKTSDDVRGFTIPLGATINMDGTALYQATATLFLCQVFGIDLSLGETVVLLITTIGASIGTPALPGVGLIVLATILSGVGVPKEGIALILGVDRLLDMCRTTINVTGDLTATTVMQRWMHGK